MKKLLLVLLSFALLFTGCKGGKKSKKSNSQDWDKFNESMKSVNNVNDRTSDSDYSDDSLYEGDRSDFKLPNYLSLGDAKELLKGSYHTDAHKKYLNDPMTLELLPFDMSDVKEAYLVASDKAQLFSADCFKKVSDDEYELVSENIKGEKIPFGAVLEGTGEIIYTVASGRNEGTRLFYFEENYNYFYGVKFNGKTGYVFGADLHHVRNDVISDPYKNSYYSELLLKNGCLDKFYDYEGDNKIKSNDVKKSLSENKLAMMHYEKKYLESDDLIDSYNDLNKYTPYFITTDLYAHAQHLIFDRILQRVEQDYFIPELKNTCKAFIEALQNETDVTPEVKDLAVKYFQVGELCLRMALKVDEDGEAYEKTDKKAVLAEYPEDVRKEFEQIESASGNVSVLFECKEMFNQYKPRGHYTKNKALEWYFRAQMWFGRIHFIIARDNYNAETNEVSNKMEPVALFIVNTVKKNNVLYNRWAHIFDPITTLIGDCDDLSFREVMPLWEDQKVDNFAEWSSDEEKLKSFVELCHKKLRPPAISGMPLLTGAAETDEKNGMVLPPMGWRFLGQRFTYDSYIHQNVSSPRILDRLYVRGLDVMKVFGSKTADSILNEYDVKKGKLNTFGYFGGNGLASKLNSVQKEFDNLKPEFWTKNYYNSVLNEIKTQACFEQGAGYYFTESPLWNVKSLISSHSTWAELRHDTILYVKQVCAEMAGGGDLEPTFRTKEIPLPINYIEPNLPFWQASKISVSILRDTLTEYNFMDDEIDNVLKVLYGISDKAIEIVKKEAADKPITQDENKWIKTIPNNLSNVVKLKSYSYATSDKELQMACIADVYTSDGLCLEVGVAKPVKLYVPLNDGQGGKRIAVGFIPDYVEFYHSAGDRMTDDTWKEMVYEKKVDIYEYEPFWSKSCILPKE
ncbi:MAG: DUF3160 domain-containing protein [Treponema sp.]|nr:DUF3160 domain-containing protein [Candidatus Treponema scatequi]